MPAIMKLPPPFLPSSECQIGKVVRLEVDLQLKARPVWVASTTFPGDKPTGSYVQPHFADAVPQQKGRQAAPLSHVNSGLTARLMYFLTVLSQL